MAITIPHLDATYESHPHGQDLPHTAHIMRDNLYSSMKWCTSLRRTTPTDVTSLV
jgi:hypothetical protein